MIDKGQWLGSVFKDYSNADAERLPGKVVVVKESDLGVLEREVWHVPVCNDIGEECATFEFTKRSDADAFKRDLKALMKKHLTVRGKNKR